MGHQPVLLAEVLSYLGQGERIRVLVDATLGGGGHAKAFLESFAEGRVVGLDRDAETLAEARSRLAEFGDRISLHHRAHGELEAALDAEGLETVDAVLFDLGVSSLQLDRPERGFTFRDDDAPLDMRMDRSGGESAAELVARLSERELADLIHRYGEERASRRIASAIVRERARAPIETAGRLAAIVRGAVPGRRGRIDKATRTFQALRIAVNDEPGQLRDGLEQATRRLRPGGRLLSIAFHSGEDRIVKNFLRADERLDVLTRKVVRPQASEVRGNPRARSARLRVAEKRSMADA